MQSQHVGPSSASANTSTPLSQRTRASPSRIAQLTTSIAKSRKDIDETRNRLDEVCGELRSRTNAGTRSGKHCHGNGAHAIGAQNDASQDTILKEARQVVEQHIGMLTEYNKLKDTAMALLEVITETEGKTVRQVMDERDILDD